MAHAFDALRYSFERFWGTGIGLIVSLMLIVAIAISFFAREDGLQNSRRGIAVVATITDLRIGVTKSRPGWMASVTAQDEKGALGQTIIPADLIVGCKVGDKIKAKRFGIALILEPIRCH